MMLVVVPVTTALCYAFYCVFERPFVLNRERRYSGSEVPLPAVGAAPEHAKPALG